MSTPQIAIIGGGPGGLMTAYTLQKILDRPAQITLFEASGRLGGKILTPHFRSAPVRYEAGAAEFYDYSMFDEDPLKDLIAELGLPIRRMGGPAVIMRNRILANMDDIRDQLGTQGYQAVSQFDRMAKDHMTPEEFYYSDYPEGSAAPPLTERFNAVMADVAEPQARQFIENLIHSDLATEPKQTSVPYGLQNYLMNDPAYMDLYGIEGGNELLPQALIARISAVIRLEHTVQSVSRCENQMRVVSTHRGVMHQDDFDYVVVALPHNHLKSVAFPGDRLTPAIERHYAHYHYPAHYLRITILFQTPFWRQAFEDSYWMLDEFGGCCLYDESSRDPNCTHGVLGWLLAGESVPQKSPLSDEQLIAEALDSLPEFLAHGRSEFVEGRVHRWAGAVNALPGGVLPQPHDQRHRPEPIEHPHLFLVGDYLYDSTLNGVLDSAEYVAGWIAAQLAATSQENR